MTVDQDRLYATTDARAWAEEWCKAARGIEELDSGKVIDLGWMIGWFANAIENAKDHVRREHSGSSLIATERRRQLDVEGYLPEHDQGHQPGELTDAAVAYIWNDEPTWPWRDGFKPGESRIRRLVKAGALVAAEIDRLLAEEDR